MNVRDDEGAAGVEAAVAVTALLAVGFFVIGALRITNTGGDTHAAARAGARAAAAEYDPSRAASAARRVVAGSLADRGVACSKLDVRVGGDLVPGGVVTVDVSCVVELRDVALAGFPGTRTLTGRAVEQVDVVRGGS